MTSLKVHDPTAPFSHEQLIHAVIGRAKLNPQDPIAFNAARLAIDFALGNPELYLSYKSSGYSHASIRLAASRYIISAFAPLGWKAWLKFLFTADYKVDLILEAMENIFWWSGAREEFYKSLMAIKEPKEA